MIKALFLINIGSGECGELLQLKQNEIAQQWDAIEYALQDDTFWYFLSNKEPPATRIELIFDLIVNSWKNDSEITNKKDVQYTFLRYNKLFSISNEKEKWVSEKWKEVRDTFQTLQEWYEDRELYHFIGFLIWKGKSISEILKWKGEKSKSEFKNKIKEESFFRGNLNEIGYGDKLVKEVLLLFNILTLLKNKTSNIFSFDKFKDSNWDIEHIHAQQSEGLNSGKLWKEWITETKNEIDKISVQTVKLVELKKQFCKINIDKITKEEFEKLFNTVVEYYDSLDEDKTGINDLSNLTLLDAGTNRSYKNAIFSVKRNKIIERDKQGIFIPICTKNVFLKYYSDDLSKMYMWTNTDRKKYYEEIEKTLNNK